MNRAETLLPQVMVEWEERVNREKTEKLRISSNGRAEYDVRGQCEKTTVRHIGAQHSERGDLKADTDRRVARGNEIVRKMFKESP